MAERRIVLVDDEQILRTVLRATLKRAGWTVLGEAADGAAGVELTLAAQPDIVLMDLHMPGMGGIDATRAIRAAAPHIEVVMFTATEDRTVFDALKAGAIGYLVKGISPAAVVASLEQVAAGGAPISP